MILWTPPDMMGLANKKDSPSSCQRYCPLNEQDMPERSGVISFDINKHKYILLSSDSSQFVMILMINIDSVSLNRFGNFMYPLNVFKMLTKSLIK